MTSYSQKLLSILLLSSLVLLFLSSISCQVPSSDNEIVKINKDTSALDASSLDSLREHSKASAERDKNRKINKVLSTALLGASASDSLRTGLSYCCWQLSMITDKSDTVSKTYNIWYDIRDDGSIRQHQYDAQKKVNLYVMGQWYVNTKQDSLYIHLTSKRSSNFQTKKDGTLEETRLKATQPMNIFTALYIAERKDSVLSVYNEDLKRVHIFAKDTNYYDNKYFSYFREK